MWGGVVGMSVVYFSVQYVFIFLPIPLCRISSSNEWDFTVFSDYMQHSLPLFPDIFLLSVRSVDAGFDEHDIPYDVLWLDIEHTDGKM